MGKKKTTGSQSKAASKASKKAKAAQKTGRKEKKKVGKTRDHGEEEDLEKVLEEFKREWEAKHAVIEEVVEGPPSRRANATFTACPSGNYLWCIGGEFFSEDGKAFFYNDVYRYNPEKDEWRKFVSPTCPGPRSAHAVAASPTGGGKLFLFGGEFSSLNQNSFHHYRDFWCFDVSSHSWDRIETKIRPTARSGCRMVTWKQYVILFGGFYDPGIRTNYLNDLWYFDTQEYRWKQVEFKETERKPSSRSGFSFLSTPEGIVLHGGYCKEYSKGKRPVGVMLDDTWFLKISLATPDASKPKADLLTFKWEKRKKIGYAPSPRSGCTMALWANKSMGVLFGGVTDEDANEETLESVFHSDLFGYQLTGNGRWISLTLRSPKKQGGKKNKAVTTHGKRDGSDDDDEEEDGFQGVGKHASLPLQSEPDDPILTVPSCRYNAMLSVLRNTLYIYGGIFERGSKEYTLDDFYCLALDKLDKFTCLKKSDIVIPNEGDEESSSDESGSSGSDSHTEASDSEDDDSADTDEDAIEASERAPAPEKAKQKADSALDEPKPVVDIDSSNGNSISKVKSSDEDEISILDEELAVRAKAEEYLGTSKTNEGASSEDTMSTPLPGETLARFYNRTRAHWVAAAFSDHENQGKELRRNGFSLAQERYVEYKPTLEQIEKILAESGLDEEEIKRGAVAGPRSAQLSSRNRR